MSLTENIFKNNGHATFNVWLDEGATTCLAYSHEGKARALFMSLSNWNSIENKNNLDYEVSRVTHIPIKDIRMVKSGWFAFATLDFIITDRRTMRGKTDKGFAEFLVSIAGQIEERPLY